MAENQENQEKQEKQENQEKWTPAQKAAIEKSGASLLISAAAGSGKTAVLTERIIESICREGGYDISRMIISTFTRAAADTLKKKLYEKLSDRAAASPSDFRISEQLIKLDSASISTIDSYCYTLFSEYHNMIGIEKYLRIGDDNEIKSLEQEAAKETIEKYASEDNAAFNKLYSVFTETRSDMNFIKFITELHKKISSFPDRENCIHDAAEKLKKELAAIKCGESSFEKTSLGGILASLIDDRLDYIEKASDYLIELIADTAMDENYAPIYEDISAKARLWKKYLAEDNISDIINEARDYASISMPKVKSGSVDDKFKSAIQNITKELIKGFSDYVSGIFDFTKKSIINSFEEMISFEETIFDMMRDFENIFSEKKYALGIASYSDIERFALEILTENKDGKRIKSAIANKISSETDAVFVDEYQDTNLLQDTIFRAISNGKNLFIVGDPKQSIYRFRNAEPEIFTSYKRKFVKYDVSADSPLSEASTIFLSDNFRCDEKIIDFTNFIFTRIMDSASEDSLYKKEDMLIHSKTKAGGKTDHKVEIDITSGGADAEAEHIAERILSLYTSKMLRDDGEPITFSDIAVLSRTNKVLINVREKLKARNIPCTDIIDKEILISEEYLFMDSILGAISNPLDDIALTGAMLSSVFRFTDDDLYHIKRCGKKGAYYHSLLMLASSEDILAPKAQNFLDILSSLREEAKKLSVSEEIFLIYRKLSVEEIYSAIAPEKSDTLAFILTAAQNFDKTGLSGISKFREYLSCEISKEAFFDNDNAVRLSTIHKSKGLEFPIVFLASGSRSFGNDNDPKWAFSSEWGAMTATPSEDGEVSFTSPLLRCLQTDICKKDCEEEKRLLYVAMTRAMKKLIITSSPRSLNKLFERSFCFAEKKIPDALRFHLIKNARSYIDLIFASLQGEGDISGAREAGGGFENNMIIISNFEIINDESAAVIDEYTEKSPAILTEPYDADKIIESLEFQYSGGDFAVLPEKLSVSEIVKNDSENDEVLLGSLMDITRGGINKSASFIGTAMHRSMQFMDFARAEKDIAKEAERIMQRKFITRDEYASLDLEKLGRFFISDIWNIMKKSPRVIREKRFNVLFDAGEFFDADGSVLIQGVIDVYFENPDGSITLLDFKTDRVRGADAEKILIDRHSRQLLLYAKAIEKMSGKIVSDIFIYSFELGKCIAIKR